MTDAPLPIFDGHNDAIRRLAPYRPDGDDFFARGERGHLDLPRAREGGFAGGLFAVSAMPDRPTDNAGGVVHLEGGGYEVPLASPLDPALARRQAIAQVAALLRLESASGGQLKVARTVAEVEACLRGGVLAAVLHFEGAEMIDPDLDALEVFFAAGLRSLGPVWSRPNAFGHGVPFAYPRSPDTGPGLTGAGRDLVRACNQLGILVDVSHLNERGFWDVAALSAAPLVATHSNAHAICPVARNLTDHQLEAVRESDGLVGLNLDVSALRPDGHLEADTPLEVVVRHLDHLVERLGIERVGLGSDFDGALVPQEIGSAAGLPRLFGVLRAHGYDEAALRKVAHENWLRVLCRTWREA